MSNIITTLRKIDAGSFENPIARKEAVREIHALLARVEAPSETAIRLSLTVPALMATLKIAIDLDLFRKWLEKNNGFRCTFEELSDLVRCDKELFRRLVGHLAATYILLVDDNGMYEMSPLAVGLVKEGMAVAINYFFALGTPPALHLPAFLQSIDHQSPNGKDKDCFKHWSNQTAWEYLAANPSTASIFDEFMKATGSYRGNFAEVYPCDTLSCGKDEYLVVDIGGSLGHDLSSFRARFPNKMGRLVLQDLPTVVENAKRNPDLDPSIELQGYDFFTPQPVIGAKLYLLHAILHDWSDHDAKRILENLKPALKPGHSKLLIHEVIVDVTRPDVESTTRDWTMMCLASAAERTEEHWRTLLTSAGLRINKIWRNSLYVETVIETEAM